MGYLIAWGLGAPMTRPLARAHKRARGATNAEFVLALEAARGHGDAPNLHWLANRCDERAWCVRLPWSIAMRAALAVDPTAAGWTFVTARDPRIAAARAAIKHGEPLHVAVAAVAFAAR